MHFRRGASYLVLLVAGTQLAFFAFKTLAKGDQRTLTFAQRVAYQRAIEEVYWRHCTWPKENLNPKPSLDAVMSQAQLESKVAGYLCDSQAFEDNWQKPITAEQLQAEIDRMARETKQPEVLRELFEALGNDPFVIAECLARPTIIERDFAVAGSRVSSPANSQAKVQTESYCVANANYTRPTISDPSGGCIDDTWTPTNLMGAPNGRAGHTAVWTGSEMIVWGGDTCLVSCDVNTGGRYNPSTDSWTVTSTANAPDGRATHTAVWTGTEMIVWGGFNLSIGLLNTGGRYNPGTDSWTATNTINAPNARERHTAVWSGSEMIIWGGDGPSFENTGGRYNPLTDNWTATSTSNVPEARDFHTAIWTGSNMIVWGGADLNGVLNTGGKYDPITDSWTATTISNAPDAREFHTAVWTDREMIIWGGSFSNTGGRYNPSTDSWTATTTSNAPSARDGHSAVWTDNEMIVWGGADETSYLIDGGRYYPDLDRWSSTSIANAPDPRVFQTAVWSGSEMLVWGGVDENNDSIKTGGRYCAQSGTPTPSPTPTATGTATPTPRPTPTPRGQPTPRPRPTPAPRPMS